jgi:hypothetical protein
MLQRILLSPAVVVMEAAWFCEISVHLYHNAQSDVPEDDAKAVTTQRSLLAYTVSVRAHACVYEGEIHLSPKYITVKNNVGVATLLHNWYYMHVHASMHKRDSVLENGRERVIQRNIVPEMLFCLFSFLTTECTFLFLFISVGWLNRNIVPEMLFCLFSFLNHRMHFFISFHFCRVNWTEI